MAYHQGDAELAGGHPNCPGAWPVGFNALDGATRAAAGWSSIFFGLFALDESDPYAWKKFDVPSAQLIVSYNSYPSAPAGRTVAPCMFVCSGVAPAQWFTNSNRPRLTANATDADGGNLHYEFEVWSGSSSTPTTRVATGSVFASQGTTGWWQPPSALPDGVYEYRTRASDGVDNGPWSSGWVVFVVDTVAPPVPTVTVSGAGLSDQTRGGTVGKPLTATFQSPAADGIQQYVYSWWSPLPTFDTPLACNGASGGVGAVCPASGGASVAVTAAAVSRDGPIYVQALDKAGNASLTTGPTLFVNPDAAGTGAGHSWPGSGSSPVGDTATANGQLLTLGSGVTWQTDQPAPDVLEASVMTFNGTATGYGQTSTAVLDTTKSFTVGAWVKPSTSGIQIVQSQHASTPSGVEPSFQMYQAGGSWLLCVPTAGVSPTNADCAITAADPSVVNVWTYVVGVWDATNKQIRIYLNGSGTPAAVTAHGAAGQASVGPMLVGRSNNWRTPAGFGFQGSIYNPVAIPGVVDPLQMVRLREAVPPNRA